MSGRFADTCPKLLEAIPSRMHHDKRSGDLAKVPGDPLNDVADSARCGIYTFITSSEKPREPLAQEAIASMAAQVDLTSCPIRWQQMTEDPRSKYKRWGWRA